MVSRCAWGAITPETINPLRPERPFRTTFPVGHEEALAVLGSIKNVVGIQNVERLPGSSYGFVLVFSEGCSRQEIGIATSIFLRKFTALVDTYHAAHVVPHRSQAHVTQAEIASAMAVGSELRSW